MSILNEISNIFQILIRSGIALRIVYCFIRIGASEEEASMYKKRIKNAIIFLIISECIWIIKDLSMFYYS